MRRQWMREIEAIRAELNKVVPETHVLELACGTGLWTEQLLRRATRVTAIDGSAEMLDLCRARVGGEKVSLIQADLFSWEPNEPYEFVFCAFWLSHVPRQLFESFWLNLRAAVSESGSVFIVDSDYNPASTARDHDLPEGDAELAARRLNDGREFRVVKVFYRPEELEQKLATLGWKADIKRAGEFFLYGSVKHADKVTRHSD